LHDPLLVKQALGGVLQVFGVPAHWPEPLHLSLSVQRLLSLQFVPLEALA
jgi:hypothetical protein